MSKVLNELDAFCDILKNSWDKSTSLVTNWSKDIPKAGQNDVTALVVKDYFGGEIGRVAGEGNYLFNIINGECYDLTFHYPYNNYYNFQIREIDREELLSNPSILERYENLSINVKKELLNRLSQNAYVQVYINIRKTIDVLQNCINASDKEYEFSLYAFMLRLENTNSYVKEYSDIEKEIKEFYLNKDEKRKVR